MNKSVLQFIASRLVIICATLSIVLINTHYLGVEGQGTASLINFGILLIAALSNFIGGGALVYLIPRMSDGSTFWPSVIWASISAFIFYFILNAIDFLPASFILHVCILGFIQSVFGYLSQVSMAKMQAAQYNTGVSVQAVSLAISLAILVIGLEIRSSWSMIYALYISFISALIQFGWYNRKYIQQAQIKGSLNTGMHLFKLGKFAQGGNILHMLNQRLNLLLLERWALQGLTLTGVFSIALYGAEVIWTVSKSLSADQYSRISNTEDTQMHLLITRKYLVISMGIACAASAVVFCLPQEFYDFIFQRKIEGLKITLLWLIPGLIANAASIIYAHYFSGTGKQRYNMMASLLGLIAGLGFGIAFIPKWGLAAAAMSTSIAFSVQAIYFFIQYRKTKIEA